MQKNASNGVIKIWKQNNLKSVKSGLFILTFCQIEQNIELYNFFWKNITYLALRFFVRFCLTDLVLFRPQSVLFTIDSQTIHRLGEPSWENFLKIFWALFLTQKLCEIPQIAILTSGWFQKYAILTPGQCQKNATCSSFKGFPSVKVKVGYIARIT